MAATGFMMSAFGDLKGLASRTAQSAARAGKKLRAQHDASRWREATLTARPADANGPALLARAMCADSKHALRAAAPEAAPPRPGTPPLSRSASRQSLDSAAETRRRSSLEAARKAAEEPRSPRVSQAEATTPGGGDLWSTLACSIEGEPGAAPAPIATERKPFPPTVAAGEVRHGARLGAGAFGVVRAASWRGASVASKAALPRRVHDSALLGNGAHPSAAGERRLEEGRLAGERLLEEGRLLHQAAHPHVLGLLAFVATPPCLVLERAATSLFQQLSDRRKARSPPAPLPQALFGAVARGVASALRFLHDKAKLAHCDLSSSNVLLRDSAHWQPLLCDFGLARRIIGRAVPRRLAPPTAAEPGSIGAAPWAAPEALSGDGPLTERVDQFSFGVLLWELATGEIPWAELTEQMQVVCAVGLQGERLPAPPAGRCPAPVQRLIERLWIEAPERRPAMREVCDVLRAAWPRRERYLAAC